MSVYAILYLFCMTTEIGSSTSLSDMFEVRPSMCTYFYQTQDTAKKMTDSDDSVIWRTDTIMQNLHLCKGSLKYWSCLYFF